MSVKTDEILKKYGLTDKWGGGTSTGAGSADSSKTDQILAKYGVENKWKPVERVSVGDAVPDTQNDGMARYLSFLASLDLDAQKKKAEALDEKARAGRVTDYFADTPQDSNTGYFDVAPESFQPVQKTKEEAEAELAWKDYNLAKSLQYSIAGDQALSELSADVYTDIDNMAKWSTSRTLDITGSTETLSRLLNAGYTKDEIDQLVDYRIRQLNRSEYGEQVQRMKDLANKGVGGAVAASAESVPLNVMSGLGYVDLAVQKARNAIKGNDRPLDYYTPNMSLYGQSSAARTTVTENIEENARTELGGKVGSFFYNTGMSMADFIAVSPLGGAGMVLLGSSAATATAVDIRDRGGNDTQALLGGALAGAAEAVFENKSLKSLFALSKPAAKETLRSGFKRVLMNVGKQGLEEGKEELFTSLANAMTDSMVMGELSSYNTAVRDYMANGLSAEEAERKATLDFIVQCATDTLAGFVSGGVRGGASKGIQTVGRGVNASRLYGESVEDLISEALEIDPNNAFAQKMQGRVEAGKRVGGNALADLVEQNEKTLLAQDKATIQNAAAERLTALGETGDVQNLAAVIAKKTAGEKLTHAEQKTIAKSKYGQRILNELNPENISNETHASEWAQQLDTNRVNVEAYRKALEEAEGKTLGDVAHGQIADTLTKHGYRLVESPETGEAAEVSADTPAAPFKAQASAQPTTIEDMAAEIGSKQLAANDVVYQAATEKFGEDRAFAVAAAYRAGNRSLGVSEFLTGFNAAYESGVKGTSLEDALSAQSNLLPGQLKVAWSLGNDVRTGKVEARRVKRQGAGTFTDKSTGKATDSWQAFTTVLEGIAKKTGIDIETVDAIKAGSKTANGKMVRDMMTIVLSRNAENNMQALGHELSEFVEAFNPDDMASLRMDILRYWAKTQSATSVNELVRAYQGTYKKVEGGKTYEQAEAEAINDALGAILASEEGVDALMEWLQTESGMNVQEQKTFLQKLADLFQNIINGLKRLLKEGGLTPMQQDMVQMEIEQKQDILKRLFTAVDQAALNARETGEYYVDITLAEAGIAIDRETDTAHSLRFSTAYTDTVNVGKKSFDTEAIVKLVAEGTGRSMEDARKWVNSELTIANIVMQNPEFLDFVPDERYTAIKNNSDYPQGTVDLSNLCPKREEFTAMFDMLQKKYPDKLFTAADVAEMRAILKKNNITVACGACFVEDRRQLLGEIADTYIGMWKKAIASGDTLQKVNAEGKKVPLYVTKAIAKQYGLQPGAKILATDTYVPTQYDLTTYEGFKTLQKEHPIIAMGFERYNNSRGQQAARLIEGRAEYDRQILGWSPAKVKRVNNSGGLRIFSFSDFEVVHLLDLVQVIMDCSAMGVKIQGYTKIPAFARLVRNTGIKLNRSLIPKGDTGIKVVNGKRVLDLDTVEGIDIHDENFMDESDNPNVGNIIIGINPEQIGIAMLDDFVDYIIPFHSNKSKGILRKLGTGAWVNYKESQHEKDISTGKASKNNVNIYTDVLAKYHPRNKVEFVEAFLKECKAQDKIPRYAEFLNVGENGDYAYREGYHKLLVDFKMFDKDGNLLPQTTIQPVLDDAFMAQLLASEVKRKAEYKFPADVYDALDEKFGGEAALSVPVDRDASRSYNDGKNEEGKRNGEEGYRNDRKASWPENRREFLARVREGVFRIKRFGRVSIAYRPARGIDKSYAAETARRELNALGIRTFYHRGLEVNDGNTTVVNRGEACCVEGKVVGIKIDAFGDGIEMAGHEAFHAWMGTDEIRRFVYIFAINKIDDSAYAISTFTDVVTKYIPDTSKVSKDNEWLIYNEYLAKIAGEIHSGAHEAELRTMFTDYDAVKAAWDKAVDAHRKTKGDAAYTEGDEAHSISPDFAPDVKAWYESTTEEERAKDGGWFKVGTTSEPLQSIGIKDRRIYIGRSKVGKIVDKPRWDGGHKGDIDINDIAKIPELLEDPVAVLKSKTVDTSIVVIGEIKATSTKTLTAVVELNPRVTGGMDADINVVVSAYDRSNENLRNLMTDSEVLYLSKDKKRTDTWLMSLRVQFPSGQPVYGSIGKVTYDGEKVKSVSGKKIKFEPIKGDEALSLPVDDQYLAAVESGDLETAQRMVDEAAKKAGYTEEVFHGMNNRHNVYKSGDGQYGAGVYFTYSKSVAGGYGGIADHLYVKVGKIADYDDSYKALGKRDDQTLDEFAQFLGFHSFDDMIEDWDNDPTDVASNSELIDLLKSKGFEGFVDDGNAGFVLWDFDGIEYRIKSAAPVTYDDNGKVIPLSERFNAENADIRYSLPVEDESMTKMTNREILEAVADQAEKADLTPGELDALRIFKARLDKVRDLQQKRAEQGTLWHDQQFGGRSDEAVKTMHRMKVLDSQLDAAEKDLVKAETTGTLQGIVDRAYKAGARRQRAYDDKTLRRYKERRDNADSIKKYRKRVQDKTMKLTEMLLRNSDKQHIPEQLKAAVGEFLTSIDFTSKRQLHGGEATKKDLRYTDTMNKLRRVLQTQVNYMEDPEKSEGLGVYLDMPDGFVQAIEEHIEAVEKTLRNADIVTGAVNIMTADELKDLDFFLTVLTSSINKVNALIANGRYQYVSEAAMDTITHLNEMKEFGGKHTKVDRFLNWDNTTPVYAFKRFGDAGSAIFEGLQDGWDKLAINSKQVIDFAKKTYTEKEVKAWSEKIHNIELDGRTAQMTTAQIMSLYCLVKREQARGHLFGGGMRIGNIEIKAKVENGKAKGKQEMQQAEAFHLTMEDVARITSLLTDRQIAVADALQKYMNTVGSKWGNEVSFSRFGYNSFTEENYFPIESDKNNLPAIDPEARANDLFRLLNMCFTKGLTPKANNALVVNNIFDVFAAHMSDMAKYNALALPVLDAMKFYNFKDSTKQESGALTTATVQKAIERAYGGAAKGYFIQFMKDLNGVHDGGRTASESFAMKMVGNYKVAAVGANLRVALLQPTSYVRASAVIDPKYLTRALTMKPATNEMLENSGIAVWKSLGFYDTNIGRAVRDQIKGEATIRDKVVEKSMAAAALGDKLTWGVLWNACKLECAAKGDKSMEAVAKRFREVVYATQVVDSTMTRSQTMRSSSSLTKMLTSFMSEPTLAYNMLVDAFNTFNTLKRKGDKNAWQKCRQSIARSMMAYVAAMTAAALAESIFDALRDDDDYETFLEKFWEAFWGDKSGYGGKPVAGNLAADLNILNKLPILKDIVSEITGYENTRMDTQWFSSIIDAVEAWKSETRPLYGKIYKTMQALSRFTGLPASNLMREVATIYNNTIGVITGNKLKTYEPSVRTSIKEALAGGHLTEDEAMQALVDKGEANDLNAAYFIVKKWMTGDSSNYQGVYEAMLAGESITAAVKDLTDHGYEEDDVLSAIKSQIGKWYKGTDDVPASITEQQALSMLIMYGGMTRDEASDKVKAWSFSKEHPTLDWSEGQITTYYSKVEPSGISVTVYDDYLTLKSSCKGTDTNGDGKTDSGSVKREVLQVIYKLPITRAQKDTLYYLNGWSESTIYEAPWH